MKVWLPFNFVNINQNMVRLVKVLLKSTCISNFENQSIYERSQAFSQNNNNKETNHDFFVKKKCLKSLCVSKRNKFLQLLINVPYFKNDST